MRGIREQIEQQTGTEYYSTFSMDGLREVMLDLIEGKVTATKEEKEVDTRTVAQRIKEMTL